MSANGLISVIIAEHNTDFTYLKKSIESILQQTYTNFEIIIVDDLTYSENYTYLENLAKSDKRVRIIRNEANLGLAASLNKAIENSKGEYIFRMDTDDIALSNRFESQIEILQKGIDITTARAETIDENDQRMGETKKFPFYNFFKRIQLYYFFRNGVIHPLVAARKEVFDEYKYDESIMYGQDYELWLRISNKYKIFFDNEILLKYRKPMKNNVNNRKLLIQYYTFLKVTQGYLGSNIIKAVCFNATKKMMKKLVCTKLEISEFELNEQLKF